MSQHPRTESNGSTSPINSEVPLQVLFRGHRRQAYIDQPPEVSQQILAQPEPPIGTDQTRLIIRLQPARCLYSTAINYFGTFREYFERIKNLPDAIMALSSLTTQTTRHVASGVMESDFGPCKNVSVFATLYYWIVLGEQKTQKSLKELQSLLSWEKYNPSDVATANMDGILHSLSVPLGSRSEEFASGTSTGWTEHEVKIAIPFPKERNFDPHAPLSGGSHPYTPETAPNIFSVPGLHIRSLEAVIREALSRPAAEAFHWTPFKQWWKPPDEPQPQQVYDELYSSPAWLEAHDFVQNLSIPGCTLPRAVAGLMLWSDSTCISDFGTKSLWPIYLFFGNQSKYDRSKPSSRAGHHIAFLPTVSLYATFMFSLIN